MRKPHLVPILLIALALAACASPRIAPPGARPGPAELTSRYFITADGLALPLRQWTPAGAPKALVLGLHGFNDYSAAFEAVGAQLAEAGVLTLAYDQRGFGAAPHRGLWPGGGPMRADAADLARLMRARWPDRPLYLLGLSMGGAVAMTALAEAPELAAGAVLVAPAVRGRNSLPVWQRWGLDLMAATAPGLPATVQGIGIEPTDNLAVLRAMSLDPLVIKDTRIDALHGLVGLMTEASAAAARQETPLLLLYGLKDDLVPKAATATALKALPQDRGHRVAVYRDGRHMLLRDKRGGQAVRDILAWMQAPSAPLPSGADTDAFARLTAAQN